MKVRSFLLFFIVLISFFGCKEVVYIEDPDVNSTAVSKVTIKFDANGGQGEMPSQKVEKSVSTQINRNIFTKSEFKFTNWNTASDGSGQNFEDSSFVKFDSDKTLYAMWLPEDAVIYKVEHYQQNLKDDNYTLLETEYKEGFNSNKASDSPREYQGFYVKDIQLSNEGTVVKVYYDRNIFTITLNTNEGNLENTEITVKYGDCLDSNLKPIKEGFYFVGWYTDENFTNLFDFSTIINTDYKLFAKWSNLAENTCTSSNVYTMIKNLTGEGPHYVKVTGAITSSTIKNIRDAMINKSSALVILDLSETTGLTKLYQSQSSYYPNPYTYYDFYDVDNLIEVKLPESVTSLGDSAFSYCASLTSVELPGSLTSIGNYTFYNCTSLTSVKLPEGTTEIKSNFFYNCTSLKSIYIPSSVTTIAVDAFKNVPLEEIIVSSDNPNYMAIDNYLYTKDGTTLVKAPSNVTEIVLSPEVTTIPDYAFYNCDNLQSITMPNVTSIGNYAFYKCDNLKTVSFLVADEITNIGNYAFHECLRLESVEHSYGISVGECAFYNCGLLKLIPNLYGSIPYCAFTLCESIEVLNFPAAIDSIDGRAFFGLYGLKEANFSDPFSCGSSNRGFAIYSKREGYWENNTVISTYFRQSEGYTFDDFQGERGASIIKRYSASKNDYFDDAWDWYTWE